jgi:hypothetical protein
MLKQLKCADSALNHLVNGPGYEEDSREPSPTKSITPLPEETNDSARMTEAKSRPGSPSDRNGWETNSVFLNEYRYALLRVRIWIRIRSDPDLFGRFRIRILTLIKHPISTFLVCVKATMLFKYLFGSLIYFLEHIFGKKTSRINLAENLFRSWSGSGRFEKLDPDPVRYRPDPPHWLDPDPHWDRHQDTFWFSCYIYWNFKGSNCSGFCGNFLLHRKTNLARVWHQWFSFFLTVGRTWQVSF